jgi:hypothetical protein
MDQAPLARSTDLIVEELEEELLVYDSKAEVGHCLSPVAARVWRRCDGRTPADGLSAQLALDADAVDQALAELETCALLEPPLEPTLDVLHNGGTTRREVATKAVKVGAGIAAGALIFSQAAPAAAQTGTQVALCANLQTNNCGVCGQNKCCCCTPGVNNPAATQACAASFDLCCAQRPPVCPPPAGGGTGTNVSNCAARGGNGQCPCPT